MLSLTNTETVQIGNKVVAQQEAYLQKEVTYALTKRILDLFLAGVITCCILIWLIPLLGLLIKLDSAGPILYVQLRTGRRGKPFRCLKLRSMIYDKNAVFKQATSGDARVTRIGAFLRRTNLDELPQFINVLLGDMSIVGPRPHAIQHDAEYWNTLPGYKERYNVKPGITGLAQVRGCRGETSQLMEMKHRIRLDQWYIFKRSLNLDIKIIWWTIEKMFNGDIKAF